MYTNVLREDTVKYRNTLLCVLNAQRRDRTGAMLNAEHVALESRLVQQMVAIRQREMDGLLARYSAIGTQASLLAGFAITSLTGQHAHAHPRGMSAPALVPCSLADG